MMNQFNYVVLMSLLSLFACSDHDTDTASQANKTIIDPQLKSLEKAKNVEQQLLDSAERLDKQTE